MPVLKNPRWERFAQELAKGQSQGDAYKAAGYDADGHVAESAGNRLLKNVEIRARLVELQERGADRVEVTTSSLITEAATIQKSALEAGQHAAAVSALTAKAKLAGKWIERKEVGEPGEFDGLTADELRTRLRSEAEAIGEGVIASSLVGGSGAARGKPH